MPSDGRVLSLRESPGRGLGLFANCALRAGTRILAEAPLIVVANGHYLKKDVEDAFHRLTPSAQVKFKELASAHGQDPSLWPSRMHESIPQREKDRIQEQHDARTGKEATVFSIYCTNAMARLEGSAVYETIARINHSCVPNSSFAWNPLLEAPGATGMETVHTIRNIAAGEEITVSYTNTLYDLPMRRWELQHYGFRCDCKACLDPEGVDGEPSPGSFTAASRERRYRLREIQELLGRSLYGYAAGALGTFDEKTRVALLLEELGLLTEEGLVSPNMGESYFELAELCIAKAGYAFAYRAAERGYRAITTCLGDDSPLAKEKATRLEEMESLMDDQDTSVAS